MAHQLFSFSFILHSVMKWVFTMRIFDGLCPLSRDVASVVIVTSPGPTWLEPATTTHFNLPYRKVSVLLNHHPHPSDKNWSTTVPTASYLHRMSANYQLVGNRTLRISAMLIASLVTGTQTEIWMSNLMSNILHRFSPCGLDRLEKERKREGS